MRLNKVILDLTKCSYAWRSWVTTCGNYKRDYKPNNPTVHGVEFDCNALAHNWETVPPSLQSHETMLQRATRLNMLDEWIPCVTFQVMANHRLTYTGDRADRMYQKWCDMQFNKNNKRNK